MRLRILSAGAAQGVVSALAARHEFALEAQFGAVGAMQEKFDAGTPCDLIVLTRRQIDALRAAGRIGAAADLGRVRTGIAVRTGDPAPAIRDRAALAATLLAAPEIYHPDAARATAGIHFAKVLAALEILLPVAARLRPHPNGASAMQALAASAAAGAIGCTQITEIRNTPGVALVGPLPPEFELATTYSAALCTPEGAPRRFFELLTGDASAALRRAAGFEL